MPTVIVPLFPAPSPTPSPAQADFEREVAARFGLVPNFFRSAPDAPFVVRELWPFAKSAYLDAPIPTLFKERLFVYLSRFCEVRYCITRHCGFLLGLGRSAGDPDASPMTGHSATASALCPPMKALVLLPDWKPSQNRLIGAIT